MSDSDEQEMAMLRRHKAYNEQQARPDQAQSASKTSSHFALKDKEKTNRVSGLANLTEIEVIKRQQQQQHEQRDDNQISSA